jgi:hypothetical protein
VTISQVDTCIAQGTADPAFVYTYITGDTLGAAWDDLSKSENQYAIDKAAADAATDSQLIPLEKSLGIPLRNFVTRKPSSLALQRNCFSNRASIRRTGV